MALVKAQTMTGSLQGLSAMPVLRQLGALIGLAAAIAVGVAVAMWGQTPQYRLLYTGLADKDAMAIAEALQQGNFKYKLGEDAGSVLVDGARLHEARLFLAGQGLPKGTANGFESLEQQPVFGTSQFMETARYQNALAGELERTIASMGGVQSARVHLAIPKMSAFVREREFPTASILLGLFPGRTLDEGQVAAIVHLVASSVPNLNTERVTLIDQQGRLLSAPEGSNSLKLSTSQFEYRKKLEEYYISRIKNLLDPLVGNNGVRAQVVADIDFNITEQTQESFNPDLPAIRSEQTTEEQSTAGTGVGGVPGALTNQPPVAGQAGAPGQSAPLGGPTNLQGGNLNGNTSRRATRNFELDRTISHIQMASGTLRRLSVAVVLDDKQVQNKEGELVRMPFKTEEVTRITDLVKEAVGFSVQRGDSVNVVNAAFTPPLPSEAQPAPPIWQQPWLWDVGKMILGGLGFLIVVFGVLRPMMRTLLERPTAPAKVMLAGQDNLPALENGEVRPSLAPQPVVAQKNDYEMQLNTAKTMVAQDPKRVAQVVKTWVGTDA